MIQMIDPVTIGMAIGAGAKIYASISGGKDGQAMVNVLVKQGIPIERLIHADLGSVEWPQSMPMCYKQSERYSIPLVVVYRHDNKGLLEHMESRLQKLLGTGKPFWPSSDARYCTSDTKREPIDKYFRNCGDNFIISAEGIRAEESTGRAKKEPLAIRSRITHSYYDGMTVKEAIAAYNPKYRLALTWYPIFDYLLNDVWATEDMHQGDLNAFRFDYKLKGRVHPDWPFHPAYVYGNTRVSCMFCVLGCRGDLEVAAEHNPVLLDILIDMEDRGQSTFKNKFSLRELLKPQ